MHGYNLQGNVTLTQTLTPAARTATATGSAVSMKDGDKTDVIFDLGAWTDGVHTFEIQEAATVAGAAGAFAAVDPSDLWDKDAVLNAQGQLVVDAADEDDTVHVITYTGGKDYLLVKQTVTGAPATGLVSGVIIAVHLLRAVGNTPLANSDKW